MMDANGLRPGAARVQYDDVQSDGRSRGRNGADGGVHRHCQDEQVDKTKAAQLIVIRIHEVDEPAPEKSRLRTF